MNTVGIFLVIDMQTLRKGRKSREFKESEANKEFRRHFERKTFSPFEGGGIGESSKKGRQKRNPDAICADGPIISVFRPAI